MSKTDFQNGFALGLASGGVVEQEYILPVGGEELGGVKNGGNVVINEDGTMTAPASGGSKEEWEGLVNVTLEEEAIPVLDIGDFIVNFKKIKCLVTTNGMIPVTTVFALSIPNSTTGAAYSIATIANFGNESGKAVALIEFEPLIAGSFCKSSVAWAIEPTVSVKSGAVTYQYNSYDVNRLQTARYFRPNQVLPKGSTIIIEGVRV